MTRSAGASLWPDVAAERRDIVELLAGLSDDEWLVPSLCDGWRVRDVAAHLLVDAPVRELGAAEVLARMVLWRFDVDRANEWWVHRNETASTASLVQRMSASLVPGPVSRILGPDNQLRASVIHHEDMRRPLGRSSVVPPGRLRAVLDAVLTWGGGANVGALARARTVRLQATDLDWWRGHGPEVRGPALSLLLALAGRPAGLADLCGDGLPALAATLRRDGPRSTAEGAPAPDARP